MSVYSFPQGGIVYRDQRAPDSEASLTAFLPSLAIVPLVQHTGERPKPEAEVGDLVREGQVLARANGPGQANIHSPVPGRILKTVHWRLPTRTGEIDEKKAFVIKMEGSFDILGRAYEEKDWADLESEELLQHIAEAGVVEMEGAGRPITEILAKHTEKSDGVTLVVRCVKDDPWLAADFCLCRERNEAVAEGVLIAAKAARANRVVVASSRNEEPLAESILETVKAKISSAAQDAKITAFRMVTGSRYPQRNEREMRLVLKSYSERENTSLGSLLFMCPSTLAAIYDAVKLRRPLLERYVAVGGEAVNRPQVVKARIGCRFEELFEACGGFRFKPGRVVIGSPLLGRIAVSLDEPLTKTCYALCADSGSGRFAAPRESLCIGCGECRRVCPVGLDGEAIYKSILAGDREAALRERADACHGCGCCEVVCPSTLRIGTRIIDENFQRHENQRGDAHAVP